MKLWHDELIALNAYIFGKIVAIDENLIYYRQHDNNVLGAGCSGLKLIFKKRLICLNGKKHILISKKKEEPVVLEYQKIICYT
jgi:hypothetical protein